MLEPPFLRRLSPGTCAALFAALYALLLLFTLNNTFPYQGDESFYTVSAARMVETGDYMIPVYFDTPRFQKPVLTYWIAAAGYKVFGVSLWSGRVPMVIVSLLTLGVVYWFALLLEEDHRYALLSVVLLASSVLFISFSRIAMTDPVLALFSTVALCFFSRSETRERPLPSTALAYACTGCAFMAKGPGGLLPPLAFAGYLVFARPERWRRHLLRLVHPLNLAILVLIAAPWYVYVSRHDPGHFAAQVQRESSVFDSFLSPATMGANLLFYLWVLLLALVPFSVLAGVVLVRNRIRIPRRMLLPAVYCAGVLILFTFFVSMRKDRYVCLMLPSLVLLVGHVLYAAGHYRRTLVGAAALSIVLLIAFNVYPLFPGEPLRKLVATWETREEKMLGLHNLEAKRRGWALLMSGGRARLDTAGVDLILTDQEGRSHLERATVVDSALERRNARWKDGRLQVKGRWYYLMKLPGGRP